MTSGAPERGAAAERDLGSDLSGAFSLLAEMTREFADSLDIEATLTRALGLIVDQLRAEAGSLWLLDEKTGTLTCHAAVGPNEITGVTLPVSKGIVGRSVRDNACQSVLDASNDPSFANQVDEASGFTTRSILCAPMTFADRPVGAIELVNKRGGDGRFDASDAPPLQVLASSAALAIANARMAASLVDHERVRRELELAAEIQRNLLPAARPAPFPVHGANVPARTVSGDFYDILPLADGRIGFCLGDVSGKGMNAAMLMAKTASLYRCLAKSARGPGRLLEQLNDELAETSTLGMFVTMAAGVLDPARGSVILANAGHEPPLRHTTSGAFEPYPAEAPPLGIAAGLVPGAYPEVELALDGGSLYLFSDGITEAIAGDGRQLGARGLEKLIARFASLPLADRVDAIIAEVGGLERRDDLTLLAVCDAAGRA